MATNEGGATPMKVPIQNGASRTSMTGETMLMNQLGRKGVILQEENKKNLVNIGEACWSKCH
jgi:hypothetical protein